VRATERYSRTMLSPAAEDDPSEVTEWVSVPLAGAEDVPAALREVAAEWERMARLYDGA
jgi:hypothetical protein